MQRCLLFLRSKIRIPLFFLNYRKFAITWHLCFSIKITIPDDFVNNVNSSFFYERFSMGYSAFLKPWQEAIGGFF